MSKETDEASLGEVNYNETLSDLSSLIQHHGAIKVAGDFSKYFPNQSNEFVHATLSVNRARSIPALFKPPEIK